MDLSPKELGSLPLKMDNNSLLMQLINKYYPHYTYSQKHKIYNLLGGSSKEVILDYFEKIHSN